MDKSCKWDFKLRVSLEMYLNSFWHILLWKVNWGSVLIKIVIKCCIWPRLNWGTISRKLLIKLIYFGDGSWWNMLGNNKAVFHINSTRFYGQFTGVYWLKLLFVNSCRWCRKPSSTNVFNFVDYFPNAQCKILFLLFFYLGWIIEALEGDGYSRILWNFHFWYDKSFPVWSIEMNES